MMNPFSDVCKKCVFIVGHLRTKWYFGVDRAIAICHACRPQPHGPRPQHPCHLPPSQMHPSLRRHFHSGSTYARDSQRYFEYKSYNISNLRISHVLKTRFPRLFLSYILFYLRSIFTYFFDLLFSKTRQHLRCNLLFGLIGHFGLKRH